MTRRITTSRGRQCDGKKRHPNKAAAEAQKWRLIRNGAHPDALNVYRCPHCTQPGKPGWHVGHRPHDRRTR